MYSEDLYLHQNVEVHLDLCVGHCMAQVVSNLVLIQVGHAVSKMASLIAMNKTIMLLSKTTTRKRSDIVMTKR